MPVLSDHISSLLSVLSDQLGILAQNQKNHDIESTLATTPSTSPPQPPRIEIIFNHYIIKIPLQSIDTPLLPSPPPIFETLQKPHTQLAPPLEPHIPFSFSLNIDQEEDVKPVLTQETPEISDTRAQPPNLLPIFPLPPLSKDPDFELDVPPLPPCLLKNDEEFELSEDEFEPKRKKTKSNQTHHAFRGNSNLDTVSPPIPRNKLMRGTPSRRVSVSCDFCGALFRKQYLLEEHISAIHRPWECEVCGKRFPKQSSLRKHKLTHSKERPFECEVCQKRFGRREHLKRHRRIHTGEKPFGCGVCGKKFGRKDHLDQHKRTHWK